MRDFDSELVAEREFKIGGETFRWRYPHWEEGAEMFDENLRPTENGDGNFTFKADTELAISRIYTFLSNDEDGHKRFKALVNRKTNPVPRHQLIALYRWLFQLANDLPTNPPSDLASGGGSSDTSSEAESSSPEVTPSE